jgi:hypothetical protein
MLQIKNQTHYEKFKSYIFKCIIYFGIFAG